MTRYAFFDLDYTLTRKDTGQLFLLFNLRRKPSVIFRLLAGTVLIPLWKLGILKLWRLKQFFFGFLKGMSEAELEKLSSNFVDSIWNRVMKAEGIAELERLIKKGYIPVLASASPHFYVKLVAKRLGIMHYAGTRYGSRDGILTGRMTGRDCRGPEKIPRIAELVNLDAYDRKNSVAYSDSNADLPLLGLAGKAYKVAKHEWVLSRIEQKHTSGESTPE